MTHPSLAEDASPEAYAAAMVKCQGYAPACSDARECLNEGACFTRDGMGYKGAVTMLRRLIDETPDLWTRSWLKVALDALEHRQFCCGRAIDALKLVAINKAVRKQYKESP
jgi:hypothetical protein